MPINPISLPPSQPQPQSSENSASAEGEQANINRNKLQQALFSHQETKSAYFQQESDGQSTGVKLDLSKNVSMGVNKKTAQMVIETKVKMSLSARFESSGGEKGLSLPQGNEEFTPGKTAERLFDFAKKIMSDFMEGAEQGEDKSEQADKSEEAFKEEAKKASEKGFKQAKQELGMGLDGELKELFSSVQSQFMEMLDLLGEENQAKAAEKAEGQEKAEEAQQDSGQPDNSAVEEIAAENSRAATQTNGIPSGIAQLLGRGRNG